MQDKLTSQHLYHVLDDGTKIFLDQQISNYRLSFQDIKKLIDISLDLKNWNEGTIEDIWDFDTTHKKTLMRVVEEKWKVFKNSPKSYDAFSNIKHKKQKKPSLVIEKKDDLGLGLCPVASPKTRCCNLYTLDAVESCGFDCSYCSIQSFYHGGQVTFDKDFSNKLKNIKLDPNQIYHIGTGQSSDSLLWGNKEGVLDALFEFAISNQNVILELKTKSKNIDYLLKNEIPKNIITTWSLNAPTIIVNEEHFSATLDERLECAKEIADKGNLVGFHFHPMVYFDNWKNEYLSIFESLIKDFDPSSVAMVSLGTLTFIKPVIKQIRSRDFYSKILQMPLIDSDGKLSYPKDIKVEMFRFAYESLTSWHNRVYFYMCMENHLLWKDVFGYEYSSNHDMEYYMKSSYMEKIRNKAL
jgi:spore photoproduct lyase